ncbi:MAG: hypothetical protein HY535_06780 [Chloroflexi bacterium]|nr:hypothetical protein [Chloroflexota bacterium]
MAQARVPTPVLLDGAQMTLTSLLAGTMGFLKQRNIPVGEWVSYIGQQFEDSWGGLEGEEVNRVLQHVVTLWARPMGAEVISSQSAPKKAEVSLTALPNKGLLEKFGTTPRGLLRGFGVTQRELAAIYGMFESPARAIGLKLTHRLTAGKQLLRLEPARGARRRQAGRRTRQA